MTIYNIDNPLSDDGRNKLNHNFGQLKKEVDVAVDTVSNKAYNQVVDAAKIEWLPPVNSFANIATTYPDATEGKTVMARDSGKVYRKNNNGIWSEIQDIDPSAINEVDSRLSAELAQKVSKEALGTYTIELGKFGIVVGLIGHKSPYSLEEWEQAYNNYEGIRNALNYAKEKGYTKVILPKNDYVICYQNPSGTNIATGNIGWEIAIPSNMTFNLGGSCISVIFDSDNRMPYDNATTLAPHFLQGVVFGFMRSYNSTIENGEVKGDRYERTFAVVGERNIEQTYGIKISKGSVNCYIRNVKMHGFMGDGITGMTDHDENLGSGLPSAIRTFYETGYINSSGALVASSGAYTTDFVSLNNIKSKELIMRTNIGFTRIPEFKNQNIDISWFDENQTFISREDFRYLQLSTIPYDAKFIRLSIYGEDVGLGSVTKTFQITPPSPHHFTIDGCEIYNNNRGGISNVVNDTVIQNNIISQNGLGSKAGFPQMGDTTRYAINIEDVVINKVTIRNNQIYESFNSVLISAIHFNVENNSFFNQSNHCVIVYDTETGSVKNNKAYNCGGILGFASRTLDRDIILEGNISMNTPSTSETGSSTKIYSSGNIVKSSRLNYIVKNGRVDNLFFEEQPNISGLIALSNVIEGSYKNCRLNYLQPQASTNAINVTTSKETSDLNINCTYGQKRLNLLTSVYGLNLNGGNIYKFINGRTEELLVENCNLNSMNSVTLPCYNNGAETITDIDFKFVNCNFSFNGGAANLFSLLTNAGSLGYMSVKLHFKNCVFSFGSELTSSTIFFNIGITKANQNIEIHFRDSTIDTLETNVGVALCNTRTTSETDVQFYMDNVKIKGDLTQDGAGFIVNVS